ncbi:MAG: hypothetical protein LBC72_04070 [Spirochaetaceae bacterium]|nr:hypothetical protein [Spirochaetaceae bacterium]
MASAIHGGAIHGGAIHGETTEGTETTRKETKIPCPFRVFPWFVLRGTL